MFLTKTDIFLQQCMPGENPNLCKGMHHFNFTFFYHVFKNVDPTTISVNIKTKPNENRAPLTTL